MGAFVLTSSVVVMCTHGGRAMLSSNAKLKVGGQPAAAYAPALTLVGCQLRVPDIAAQLQSPTFTTKVTSNGQPLMLMTLTASAKPTNSPTVPLASAGQSKVMAS